MGAAANLVSGPVHRPAGDVIGLRKRLEKVMHKHAECKFQIDSLLRQWKQTDEEVGRVLQLIEEKEQEQLCDFFKKIVV